MENINYIFIFNMNILFIARNFSCKGHLILFSKLVTIKLFLFNYYKYLLNILKLKDVKLSFISFNYC